MSFPFDMLCRHAGTLAGREDRSVSRHPPRPAACGLAPPLAVSLALFLSSPSVRAADDAIVVTATRFPERAANVPIGTRVITADDIRASPARTLPELLGQLGGLNVRNTSGSPDMQVDLRGFGATGDQNTLLLLDGQRINEPDLSTPRLSSIPLAAIERIEILPGAGAVQYGGGATGGTINIITRGVTAGAAAGGVFGGVGTYGTTDLRANASIAGERMGLSLYLNRYDSDNYRENNDVKQQNLLGDVRWGDADASIGVRFGLDRQNLGLPGALTEAQIAANPRQTFTPDDYSLRDGGFATLNGRARTGAFELAADLGYRDNRNAAFFKDYAFGLFDFYNETRRHGLSFSPRVRWEGGIGAVASTLVAGYDWADWDWNNRSAQSAAGIGSPAAETDASQTQNALYAQWLGQLTPRLRANLGARTERVEYERLGITAATNQSQTDTLHAYDAGLRYALTDTAALVGRVGRSFRIPTVDDNGLTASGNLLVPQTSYNYEIGAEYRAGPLAMRANLYLIRLDNEIYFSPLSPNQLGFFLGANVNLPPTERRGVELAADWRASPTVDVGASLNVLQAEFREGTFSGVEVAGNEVPLVPNLLATLRAGWEFLPRARLAAVYTYVGKQRYDNDQANRFRDMPSYGLADLRLSYEYRAWRFAAAANNLFDELYYSYGIVNNPLTPTSFAAYPQAGRTYFASVEYRFQ
jgi:iron complex outermembrane receptor protein